MASGARHDGDRQAAGDIEPPAAAIEEAAAWHACLGDESAGEAERAAFERWRAAAPEHDAAWARIEALSGRLAAAAGPGARQAVERTVAEEARARRRALRGALLGLVLAVGLLPLAWLAVGVAPPGHLLADWHTGVGERRDITLADGSRVVLNTATAIDVALGERRRRVTLHAGEIEVTVAEDARPFAVVTDTGRARALGTRFAVRVDESAQTPVTEVVVRESTVELCPAGGAAGDCRRLGAGERARTDGARVSRPRAVDATAATAWPRGRLVVDDAADAEVLGELGRYRRGLLQYDAAALAEIRVSGVLPLDDTDRALRALAAGRPIEVSRYTPWVVVISPAR